MGELKLSAETDSCREGLTRLVMSLEGALAKPLTGIWESATPSNRRHLRHHVLIALHFLHQHRIEHLWVCGLDGYGVPLES